jgi:hypothetical protein
MDHSKGPAGNPRLFVACAGYPGSYQSLVTVVFGRNTTHAITRAVENIDMAVCQNLVPL